jgi:uncharacterized small protein (DUF1192 family)
VQTACNDQKSTNKGHRNMNESSAAPTSANTPTSTPITRSLLFEAVTDLYEQIALLKEEIAELKAAS